jgi:hypothetical protein
MPTKLADFGNPIGAGPRRGAARRWPGACSRPTRMRLGCLTALVSLWGCVTPSVPLPPPDLPALTFSSDTTPGLVVITGKPSQRHANARFYVFDFTTGDGVITKAAGDGSFSSMPFGGGNGDGVQIYYDTTDGDRSQDVCTTLQLNVGLISLECP